MTTNAFIRMHWQPGDPTKPIKDVEAQVPYAMALGLSELAQDASDWTRARMPDHFDIRSQWTVRGVVPERAQKADFPHCASAVGVLHDRGFLAEQTEAGTKRPTDGHRAFAVPMAGSIRAHRAPLRGPQSPGKLMRRKKGTKVSKDGLRAGTLGLWRGSKKRMKLAWIWRETIVLRKAWPFFDDVNDSVRQGFDRVMARALDRAIKTAKGK